MSKQGNPLEFISKMNDFEMFRPILESKLQTAEVQDGDEEALGYAIKGVFPNLDVETIDVSDWHYKINLLTL